MARSRLSEQLARLPDRPGVYVFRDASREILYVGKAKSLRSRVRSYFGSTAVQSVKWRELGKRIHSLETFVVDSEAEALLLESNLIKEHVPRFNIQLRDDKTFPYVKVTVQEPFPRVLVTRLLRPDGSRYFGPYTDVGAMRRALRTIRQVYTIRSCHYDLPQTAPDRPCLDYHIDRCQAPCVGLQAESEYRQMIDEILEILAGRTGGLKRTIRERMEAAAADLEFERAAELHKVLRGLEVLERRQATVDFRGGHRDALGIAREGTVACCLFLKVREGRLLGRAVRFLHNVEQESEAEVTAAAVKGHYLGEEDLPPELLVPTEFADRALVERILSGKRGGAFAIHVPQRGRKRRLIQLAAENARHLLAEQRGLAEAGEEALAATAPAPALALKSLLELDDAPRKLACFDVSTLAGRDSVGSLVWLRDGRPLKDEYRRFRIRGTPEGQSDDYAMMQEIVSRYFQRRVRESRALPDLVVIDGGKGQLAAARHAMESAGVSDLPAIALAKRQEEVFRPGSPAPLRLDDRSPALHWLQRARDEAHRFAVGYHRSLRRRRTLRSRLSEVPGIGRARETKLIRHFGSLDAIEKATLEELVDVPGIGEETARRIDEFLRSERRSGES